MERAERGNARPPRVLRPLAAISFGATVALAAGVAGFHPSPTAWALLTGCAAVGALAWWAAGRPGTAAAGPVLLAVALNTVLGWPELALRLADFRHEAGVEFGFPRRVDFTRFTPDPDLFWTYPRSSLGVNAFGFRDEEVATPKPEGVVRILFLGDSCTDLGDPNYPTLVERMLNAQLSADSAVEAVVMAVSGYSSHQGRVIAEKHGASVAPDAVVVYFGWNDHWRAFGAPDAGKRRRTPEGPLTRAAGWVVGRGRLLQAGRYLAVRIRHTGEHSPPEVVRVPLPAYRKNLTAIAARFAGTGARVILVTAPTTWYRVGASQRHIDEGYVPDAATAVARHRAYNEVVRQVAATTGSLVLDLEREFGDRPDLTEIMMNDGIHFSQRGLEILAGRVAEFLRAQGVAPPAGAE